MNVFIIYVAAALVFAHIVSRKSDRKLLSFIFSYWLFTQPVFNTVLLLHTPGLGFDLQPNRVLLVLLLPYLFAARKNATGEVGRAPFEKYLYIYLILVFISLAINFNEIRKQHLAVVPIDILTFLVVYHVVKRHATSVFMESIINAVILMAVFSALISFVQIIQSDFLKTCPPRIAFGSVVRSSGIYQSEYELGYFQILSTIISLIKFKGSFWRMPLVLLFSASIVTTFHRLDILILFTCLAIYIWYFGNHSQKISGIAATVVFAILGAAFLSIFGADYADSEFVEQRLAQDTVTGRFRQNLAIIEALPEFGLAGMGDYTNKAYFKLMKKHDMVYRSATQSDYYHQQAYGVHNGFLEVATLYGIFAMLCFTILIISMFMFFKKHIKSEIRYAAIPFFSVLIWMLSNISNAITSFRIYFLMLLAIIAGSLIAEINRQKANHNPPKSPLV